MTVMVLMCTGNADWPTYIMLADLSDHSVIAQTSDDSQDEAIKCSPVGKYGLAWLIGLTFQAEAQSSMSTCRMKRRQNRPTRLVYASFHGAEPLQLVCVDFREVGSL